MVSAKRKWTDILPEVPQAAWAPADPKEIADIRDMRTQVIESDNSWWILNVVIKLPVGCVLIIAGVFLFRRNREEVQGVGQASHAV